MAVGTVCGLLLDLSCGKLMGYNAVWMVICCVTVSLLYNYLLRQKLLNILILTAACTAVQGYLDFIFYYAIWGHKDVVLIYTQVIFPSGILTLLSTVIIYVLVKKIAKICGNRRTHELEKTMLGAAYRD
jgi:cell shape-determining protein MreD